MDLRDIFRTILLFLILALIKVYRIIGGIFCALFHPLIKYLVNKLCLKWFQIRMNGPSPIDPQIKNERRFYSRCAIDGSLGFLETYVDGDWEVEDFYGLMLQQFDTRKVGRMVPWTARLLAKLNLQTAKNVWTVGQMHYDKTSPIIAAMLDKQLQYTCGYWKNATDLDTAQIDKMDLIARKLNLKPGMKVLDIGCGYGTLCHYLAKNYGVKTVGCSVSEEQTKYAIRVAKQENLPCEFVLCDYRDYLAKEHKSEFDRIVSVGMFEHVGRYNYRTFFKVCDNALREDGILLLHTIGVGKNYMPRVEPWLNKWIFPFGQIPRHTDIIEGFHNIFLIEDWHNFGNDYALTLKAWEENFNKVWPKLKGDEYDDKFHRMWTVYLQMCQAIFASRLTHLFQIVLSKDGIRGGYQSSR